jgi:hypothetical protein
MNPRNFNFNVNQIMKNTLVSITLIVSLLTAFFIALCLWGCASAPTKLEQGLFDIKTNYVPVVVLQTNTVWQTNAVIETRTLTNAQNVVIPFYVTNTVTIPSYSLVTVTQQIPQYEYLPGAGSSNATAIGGSIGNIASPGVGGPIAAAVLSLVFGAWRWVRSNKATATATNTAQVVEVARDLIKTLPNGQSYDAVLVNWMQGHQAEAGVTAEILDILAKNVDSDAAKETVKQLQSALTAIQTNAPAPKA